MTDLQLELTRLIGRKEASYGCFTTDGSGTPHIIRWGTLNKEKGVYHEKYDYDSEDQYKFKVKEIIGHPATLSDLHRWMGKNQIFYAQSRYSFAYSPFVSHIMYELSWDSTLDLLDQSESTLQAIINLIKEHEKDSMEAN